MKKLKCAVIGVGHMGAHHARVYSQLANLVAVSDLNKEQGIKVAQKYQADYYVHYEELLKKKVLDVVSIAVPTKHHYEVALKTLKRKIPTLVEKPIAKSVKKAKKLHKIAQKKKVGLMVGHIERFNPAVQKLKQLLAQNIVGEIIQILAIRAGVKPPQTSNSDVVLDLAIHDIDICNFLLDTTPDSSQVFKNKIFSNQIADSADIQLTYHNKIRAMICTNWVTPIKMRKLYVTGIKGYLELDYITQDLLLYQKKIPPSQIGNFYDFTQFSEPVTKKIKVNKSEPLSNELEYFLANRNNVGELGNYTQSAISALEVVKNE